MQDIWLYNWEQKSTDLKTKDENKIGEVGKKYLEGKTKRIKVEQQLLH